jgi:type VI secretion system protein ImpK
VDLAADWFSIVLALNQVEDVPDAEVLRTRFLSLKGKLEADARTRGITDADVADALFALVALADETILPKHGPGRDAWLESPLSVKFYDERLGGEKFFDRLEKLSKDPVNRVQALEVYACCLALGFEGRYAFDSAALAAIEKQVLREVTDLQRGGLPPLSPNVRWYQEVLEPEPRGVRWWMPPLAALLGAVVTIVIVRLVAMILAGGSAGRILGAPL